MDIRKYGIAIAVAILAAIFIYAMADAIAPRVNDDHCYQANPYYAKPVAERTNNCVDAVSDPATQKTCQEGGYSYEAVYNADGCVASYNCNTCYKEQQDAQQKRNAIFFYVSIALGLLFIVAGFILPLGTIHEWVGLGFIMGGVIGLFIGTVAYWSDLARWLRPLVILLELGVVLAIVYKRMGSKADEETPAPAQDSMPAVAAKKKKK